MSHPLGNLLRKHRKNRGLTLRMLAARMGCSGAYISKIEAGRAAPSEPAFLGRMAKALHLTESESRALFHSASISQRVIELGTSLNPMAYEVAHLFARCFCALTENELAEVAKFLSHTAVGREICEHPS